MSAISIVQGIGSDATGEIASSRIQGITEGREAEKGDAVAGLDFGKVLETVAAQANEATDKSEAFARGALDDIHGTMIAMKEAEISLKLVGSVRNKILDAFQELWRTNV